jgi:hypothetical protein
MTIVSCIALITPLLFAGIRAFIIDTTWFQKTFKPSYIRFFKKAKEHHYMMVKLYMKKNSRGLTKGSSKMQDNLTNQTKSTKKDDTNASPSKKHRPHRHYKG